MSHMGKVIRAVRRLFNNRGEMLNAIEKDPPLYEAAKKFNEAVDQFEERMKNENT